MNRETQEPTPDSRTAREMDMERKAFQRIPAELRGRFLK